MADSIVPRDSGRSAVVGTVLQGVWRGGLGAEEEEGCWTAGGAGPQFDASMCNDMGAWEGRPCEDGSTYTPMGLL